ncbi:MAG TPA: diaminopimelate decarboxylase [Gemmatimonadales bacterium]|nr:diaminopimelate decarboxylase [Gemmatimonadales bacterium]
MESAPRGGGAGGAGRIETLLADGGLTRVGPSLLMGGVRLSDLAAAVGTPAYVYNLDVVRQRYAALALALAPVPHRICYAVKANGNLAVLHAIRQLGAGADIVSAGELARARAAGFAPERIVFSGVGKRPDELRTAVRAGVGHINVESLAELERLGAIAAEERRTVAVGIRVNPNVTADTHPYIATGGSGIKFGVPVDQVRTAAEYIGRHPQLELTTLAMHLGSQLREVAPYAHGLERLLALVDELRGLGARGITTLDLGGGLGIQYHDEAPLTPAQYAGAILPRLRDAGLTVVVEPGRYLVGPAGVLLAEVLYRKHSGGKDFVVLDTGMTDLIRPSLYQAYHEVVELEAAGRASEQVDVVGPVCETGDFLALDRVQPALAQGERVALLGAGAYGFVMASNYNARPRPPEVVVDRGRWWVARPRETVEALIAGERITE